MSGLRPTEATHAPRADAAGARIRTFAALALAALRVALVAAASALTWLSFGGAAAGLSFPPPAMLASLAMLPVNLICLWLAVRLIRSSGGTTREMFGFEPRRLGLDALWGALWLVVMYLPFVGTLMLVVWLQYGSEMFSRMEPLFVDPAGIPALEPATWVIIGVIVVVTFAPLNAPTEELVYRGIAQGTLQRRRLHAGIAIVVPAALFALQHIWYAATPAAVLPFVCAFFVWGLCSGLIYRCQKRLMPLVFAHLLVNLAFTVPVLFLPHLAVTGV